jgi:hypothetical protein
MKKPNIPYVISALKKKEERLDAIKEKVRSNRDAMISTLTTVDEGDTYLQGLVRGEITAFENVLEMLEEK